MKQLLVLLFLVSSMACFGQNKDALKDISSVTFYGIDFTRAKVYGAKEGPMQFKYTFDDINKLFITEPKKYDIGKRLGVNVEVTSLEAVNDANKTINPDWRIRTHCIFKWRIAKQIYSFSIWEKQGITRDQW